MENKLPEKSCSIERLITNQKDIEKALAGKKVVTRRNGRYADVGEVMTLDGKDFTVTNVYKQKLGEMTNHDAQEEGYEDMAAYKQHLKNIHPFTRKLPFTPWVPMKSVWVHEFTEM